MVPNEGEASYTFNGADGLQDRIELALAVIKGAREGEGDARALGSLRCSRTCHKILNIQASAGEGDNTVIGVIMTYFL